MDMIVQFGNIYQLQIEEDASIFNPPCRSIQIKKFDLTMKELFRVCLITRSSNPSPQLMVINQEIYLIYQSELYRSVVSCLCLS